MSRHTEIYVSVDVEADGPIPGPYSMLSLGAAAFEPDKTLVSTFEANLETLPGASQDPETLEWWKEQPEAWEMCRRNLEPPDRAMKRFAAWISGLRGKVVFVGYPASFDFCFVHWYLVRFTGSNPFTHSALDIRTYAMALLKIDFRLATKKNMPKRWFDPLPHTHRALDDALEQGALFCNMLRERLAQPDAPRPPKPSKKEEPGV